MIEGYEARRLADRLAVRGVLGAKRRAAGRRKGRLF